MRPSVDVLRVGPRLQMIDETAKGRGSDMVKDLGHRRLGLLREDRDYQCK